MLIQILMFPGVLFHELAHYLTCIVLGIKVTKFRVSLKNESGFVEHRVPKSIVKSFLISASPFVMALVAAYFLIGYSSGRVVDIAKMFFAFILLYNSFPSSADSKFYEYHNILKKIIVLPITVFFKLFYFISRSNLVRILLSLSIILLFIIY